MILLFSPYRPHTLFQRAIKVSPYVFSLSEMFTSCIVPAALLFATVIQIINIFFFVDLLRKAMKAVLLCKYDEGSAKIQEAIFRYVV